MIIPKDSSIFCAAGMLMSDLKHDFVRTYATKVDDINKKTFKSLFNEMKEEGIHLLKTENIPEKKIKLIYSLDLRYIKQYHEVNVIITREEAEQANIRTLSKKFHPEHNRLYGYSLEKEGTPIELINMRLTCIGKTEKPRFSDEKDQGEDASIALKGNRKVYLPDIKDFEEIYVFDGSKLKCGNKVIGPGIIEQVNTTTFVSPDYNVVCDKYGSYTMYLKDREKEFIRRINK